MAEVSNAPALSATPLGPYYGTITSAFRSDALASALLNIDSLLESDDATLIAGGRNRNVRVSIELDTGPLEVMVKAFGSQSAFKDRIDSRRGSKACRSWLAATHLNAFGVRTPIPIGFLERWEGKRLAESYFLTVFEADVQNLNDALVELFFDEPECERFMTLLQGVAGLCRQMHDAGFAHRDLGNQNILMRPHGEHIWTDFQIIDLNRGRREDGPLSRRARARDLSRLDLPSAFTELFHAMYWENTPPRDFQSLHRWYRRIFQWHAKSRRLRHPIREARSARAEAVNAPARTMPLPRDLWVWDSRTDQAFGALSRKDRLREYPRGRYLRMLKDSALSLPAVWRAYRQLRPQAFTKPIDMSGRLGLAIEPEPASWERMRNVLSHLPDLPVLLRFYHHDDERAEKFRQTVVSALARDGHPVKIALVQDRKAVNHPSSWNAFVTRVIDAVGDDIQAVEVGHAINRVKWGVWDFDELARLYAPIETIASRWPTIHFVGPATIDFEYLFTLSALGEWPASLPARSLSHHLYVDRRGAPENPQTGFGSIEKFALARAISQSSVKCDGRVVVSEVNWPLDGTGIWSPVAPPYLTEDEGAVGVDEKTNAAYMLRYLLLGFCSGFVDRVYWWRLVARGYGLIDDTDPTNWRERIGFHAFCQCYQVLGTATFRSARLPPQSGTRDGAYLLTFETKGGETIIVAWSHGESSALPVDIRYEHAEDMAGTRLDPAPMMLSGEPIYLRGAELPESASR